MDDVLVIGEALVDIVSPRDGGPPQEHPGGSPTNVALGLARLGRRATLLARMGDDARGRAIRDHLEASGVRIAEGSVTAEPTSTAAAVVDEDGIPTYHFDVLWTLPPGVDVTTARALHTGSIATFLQPGGDDVLRLVEESAGRVLVSYDPNARPQFMGAPADARTRVERFVAAADVVKVSDEDVRWMAPGEDPLDVVRQWQTGGPSLVVLTRGPAGVFGITDAGVVEVPTLNIEVADTVGAGDATMAGLLDALITADLLDVERKDDLARLGGDDLAAMLAHAVRVAAFTCTRAGAEPPTRAELAAWTP